MLTEMRPFTGFCTGMIVALLSRTLVFLGSFLALSVYVCPHPPGPFGMVWLIRSRLRLDTASTCLVCSE